MPGSTTLGYLTAGARHPPPPKIVAVADVPEMFLGRRCDRVPTPRERIMCSAALVLLLLAAAGATTYVIVTSS